MPGKFDPHHKWLGVPPQHQPANYYRLLGLEAFEDDADVIEAAADRLIQYVRDVSTSEHQDEARIVLEELTSAKRCLLDEQQRTAYNAGLRANLRTSTKPPDPPVAQKTTTPASISVSANRRHDRRKANRKPPRTNRLHVLVVIGAVLALGLFGVGRVLLLSDSQPKPEPVANRSIENQKLQAAMSANNPPHAHSVEEKVVLSDNEAATTTAWQKEGGVSDSESRPVVAVSQLSDFPVASKKEEDKTTEQLHEPSLADSAQVDVAEDAVEVDANESSETSEMFEPEVTIATVESLASDSDGHGVLREVWLDVTGNNVEEFVAHVREHPKADRSETIDQLETPEDYDDQYGQRLRGYLHAPATGEYEFSIRANAEGWLFVGTDATCDSLRRIEPKTPIQLQANEVYCLEAFHKESTGRDYLSIGWKLPDGTEENPIPRNRLTVQHRIAPQHETEFVVLQPISAASQSGTKLSIQEDGRILAARGSASDDTYQLKFETDIATITAVRLEAVPDESLPASGPGQGIGGRFTIGEVSIAIRPKTDPDSSHVLDFTSVVDQQGKDLRRIVDGTTTTTWRGTGRGSLNSATFVIRDAVEHTGGSVVEVNLQQRESLGSFRVLATSAPNPISAVVPKSDVDEDTYVLHVNLGGDDFVTQDGVQWRSSKFFDNETFGHEGGRVVSEDLLSNKVQGTALRGVTAFRAVVPNGNYNVTLYFCEYWSTTASSRRFAIAAEQKVIAPRFSLLDAAGGFAKPFALPVRNLTVTDGRLDIQLQKTSESSSTILNAISIEQVQEKRRR